MKKYILSLFLGLTLTLNAQDIDIQLPVVTQEQSKWCGAAVSQSVLLYFGPYVWQCIIMEYVRTKIPTTYGFPLSKIGTLKITNPLGVTVYQTQNVTEHTIQLQNSATGMFFVVITLKDGNVLTQKMVVQW